MEKDDQVIYRDAFLGNVQRKARVLQRIRFPMVGTFCRPNQSFPVRQLKMILEMAYCQRGELNVISQRHNKIMVMFSDDSDARVAYRELHLQTIEDLIGPLFQFKVWDPTDELGYDISDQRVVIDIKGLPLHLWNKSIVDQILHPYSALTHVSEETSNRKDLSVYTCFGWNQERISIPSKISLKVVKKRSGEEVLTDEEEFIESNVYNLDIDSIGYVCDPLRECSCNETGLNRRYEDGYDPDNAECFLTEPNEYSSILEELNSGVVATAQDENHKCTTEDVKGIASSYVGVQLRVFSINKRQFFIMTAAKEGSADLKPTLLKIAKLTIRSVTLDLDQWKPVGISEVEKITEHMKVTVDDLPAHLCTEKIVSFLLSPYCVLETRDEVAESVTTTETYTCTAWGSGITKVPKRIMTALYPATFEDVNASGIVEHLQVRTTQLLLTSNLIKSTAPKVAGTK